MGPVVLVVIIVIVGVAIAMASQGGRARRARPEDLARWAESKGWRFEHLAAVDPGLAGFEAFGLGHRRRGLCTIRGVLTIAGRAYEVVCGDYELRIMSVRGKRPVEDTHVFSYLHVRLPERTPDLSVRRKGVLGRLMQGAGLDDFRVANEEFGRRYRVTCTDLRFAMEVMRPAAMELLLTHRPEKVEIRGGYLCFVDAEANWSPAKFEGFLAFAGAFLELWPEAAFRFAKEPAGPSE